MPLLVRLIRASLSVGGCAAAGYAMYATVIHFHSAGFVTLQSSLTAVAVVVGSLVAILAAVAHSE